MGYIGSHTVVVLVEAGLEVALYNNLCNSKRLVLDRLNSITENLLKKPFFNWSSPSI